MSKPQARLGKGLSALIGPRPTPMVPLAVPAVGEDPVSSGRLIPIGAIRANPRQPRATFNQESLDELTDSIRRQGVLQPVLVRPLGDAAFELVAGERRWRAAKAAGLERIPAVVRAMSDNESLEIALVENLRREDLAPLERAAAYQQFIEAFQLGVDELATRISESRANVANYLRLLRLGSEIQAMLRRGELGMAQARAIAGVADPHRQLAIARLTVRRNLSVRQVEVLVKEPTEVKLEPKPESAAPSRHLTEVEKSLSRSLGLPVKLIPGKKKNSGRLVIQYNSLDEFDRIAAKLGSAALRD